MVIRRQDRINERDILRTRLQGKQPRIEESVRGIMVQNTLLADQCICEVLQVWPISQYLRIKRSVNRNCISGIFPPDYLSVNTRLGLQENRDSYGTEIMRFFYSYLVVLGHYSRVILCLILVFNQYFRGQLEPY